MLVVLCFIVLWALEGKERSRTFSQLHKKPCQVLITSYHKPGSEGFGYQLWVLLLVAVKHRIVATHPFLR